MPTTTPTKADLVAYLRLEPEAAAAEDALLDALLARAVALAQGIMGVPIDARAETFVVDGPCGARAFRVPAAPLERATPAPVVADAAGRTVDVGAYRVDAAAGLFVRTDGGRWDTGPYTVTVTWGLSARGDYALAVQPAVAAAVLDLAADLYQNRNPSAVSESAGGGVSVTTGGAGVPPRVAAALAPYGRVPG